MARIEILSPAQRIQLFSLSEEMNRKDMVRYYTLSASDLQIIRKQREEHNQLGFAVQLAYHRFPARPFQMGEPVPRLVLQYVPAQLTIDPEVHLQYAKRDTTRRQHIKLGHFQIVKYVSEEDQQEIEVYNEGLSYFGGTWQYLGPRDHTDTEKNTPEYGDPDRYAFTKIDLGDRSAESAWDILTQAHRQFSTSGTNINYDIQKNSNSYATTLLSVIGVDIADYADKAKPKSVISFPGQGVNVLGNSDDAISLNLQGRDEYGDIIRTGVKDDSLSGLAGSDELSGGGGNDVLRGGAGMDTLDPPFCDAIE